MKDLHPTSAPLFGALAALLLGASILPSAASTEPKPTDVVGEAFRQGSNTLLYRERHQYTIGSSGKLEHQVSYTQPDGTAWAHKKILYDERPTAPGFELSDTLNSESLSVQITDNVIGIVHTQEDKTQEYQLDSKSPLVIDAGFDPFVRHHWQSLSNGDSETFYFLLPRREKLVKLRLTPHTCSDFEPANYLCLALDIDNWLLRMLVDSIELTYHRDERRLIRYLGVSNLSFPGEEDSPQVDIRYRPVTDTANN